MMQGVVVYADHADDIAITDETDQPESRWPCITQVGPQIYTCTDLRPFSIFLKECSHVLLRDFTLKDSAFWTLRLLGCDDVLVDAVRIDGDLRMPNNDGIDIDWSSNVRVLGCHITTGDDCISLKTAPLSEGVTRPCENVIISGCAHITVVRASMAKAMMSEDSIHDGGRRWPSSRTSCRASQTPQPRRQRQAVLFSTSSSRPGSSTRNGWGRGEPIQVLALAWTAQTKLGVIRDIRFSNLICNSENGAIIWADETGHIANIS